MNFHLLFEQSGRFKNVLKSKGHNAFDYDIKNDFSETDFVIDLFSEIEIEYRNLLYGYSYSTIFSNLSPDKDFIIAFFPCTYFCDANSLQFKLNIAGKKRDFNFISCERLIKRNRDRSYYFEILLKFCLICKLKGIKCIIENPASGGKSNYLVMYLPIDNFYHESDRSLFGDEFKKPTNYFCINFDMKEKFLFYDKCYSTKTVMSCYGCKDRSLISSRYIENFYNRFLSEL